MQRQMAIFVADNHIDTYENGRFYQSATIFNKGSGVAVRQRRCHEKMLSLAKKLKREKHEAEKEELSKAEKQEVLDDLREAFKELKDVKEGKVELQSARDFLYEVRDKGR